MYVTNQNLPPQNPNVHDPSLAERAGVVALTALAGYGIHKGIQTAPVHETVGSPLTEVAEVAFMGGALAVTGLREVVMNGRIGLTEARSRYAHKQYKKVDRLARNAENDFRWIMQNDQRERYTSGGYITRIEPTLGDKIGRVARQIRHPFKKAEIDPHRPTVSGRQQRQWLKMNVKRDKRKPHDIEAEWMDERFARTSIDYGNRPDSQRPGYRTSDLGTEAGWRWFYQRPRTRAEVKGYKSAIKTKHHADHVAHKITHKTKETTATRQRRMADAYEAAKKRHDEKAAELKAKRERIRNREDRVSKIYDATKAYPGKVAESFREGRDGTTTNDGRIQARINAAARKLGEWRGKKATPKAPTPPTP